MVGWPLLGEAKIWYTLMQSESFKSGKKILALFLLSDLKNGIKAAAKCGESWQNPGRILAESWQNPGRILEESWKNPRRILAESWQNQVNYRQEEIHTWNKNKNQSLYIPISQPIMALLHTLQPINLEMQFFFVLNVVYLSTLTLVPASWFTN